MKTIIFYFILFSISFTGLSQTKQTLDELYLKTGDTIKCKIIEVSKTGYLVKVEFDGELLEKSYPVNDVSFYAMKSLDSIQELRLRGLEKIKLNEKIDTYYIDKAGKSLQSAGTISIIGTFLGIGMSIVGGIINEPKLAYSGLAVSGISGIISVALIIDSGHKLRLSVRH